MRHCADLWPRQLRRVAAPAAVSGWLWLCVGLLLLAVVRPVWAEAKPVNEQAMLEAHARAIGEVPSINEAEATRAALGVIGQKVPEFVMRDRRGKPVHLSSYRGKPLLVSFIYTGCFEVCPTQTRTLYEAVKGLDRLLGENQFNVISIGFNQPFDTPEAMRSFASQHRIRHRNWEFLSPTPQQVDELARAFGFSYVATPAGFDHVLGVTVLDAEGRIHTQVLGDRMSADRLGSPMRQLLLWDQDTPDPDANLGAIASVVERVRILCTVYDAKTGEYRFEYKLILEILSGFLFFFSVILYGLREWWRQYRARRTKLRSSSCPTTLTMKTAASGNVA